MQRPVYKRRLFEGRVEVAVYGAGRNWNFAGETGEAIEAGNPGITFDLGFVMGDNRVTRALVPKPAFNAVLVAPDMLTSERLPRFFRGLDADGVVLTDHGDAYALASADCLAAVLFDPSTGCVIAMHCGRNALVDRDALNGKLPRVFPSIVDAGICHMVNMGANLSRLQVFLAAGIGPDSFTHPTTAAIIGADGSEKPNIYHSANETLIGFLERKYNDGFHVVVTDHNEGKISLVELVTAQLAEHGVTRDQIEWDEVDTATDTGPNGEFLYHSNRRDKTLRNLVLVKRV